MPRKLTANEIDNIMVGATFLGAGGGGPLDTGRELLEKQATGSYSIDLYSMDEIAKEERDSTYGAMVACLGSPQKIKENGTFGPDGVACFDAFKKAMLLHDKKIKYLYSGEMGGMNTMVPMLVSIIAKQQGGASIGLLDFDANGRAVPELNTSLNAARGFAPNPVGLGALPTVEGKACTECIIECETDTESEAICRKLCEIYNSQVGFSTWAMSVNELKDNSVLSCVSTAEMIGENIKMIQKLPELDLAGVLNDAGYTCRRIIRGKIKDKIIEVVHGFDLGRTIIWDEETGEDYTICFQNENLYVYKGTEPTEETVLITAPELISVFCRLDKNGKPYYLPVDNSTTEIGMSVDVIVSPADKKWWAKDKHAYRCWQKTLKDAEYYGAQINYTGEHIK